MQGILLIQINFRHFQIKFKLFEVEDNGPWAPLHKLELTDWRCKRIMKHRNI